MKSILRNRIAAALVPVAALLVAGTAAAQGVYVQAQVAAPPVAYGNGYNNGAGWGQRDHRPPQIVDVTPDQGQRISERGRTHIRARIVDHGTGIDSRSLMLRVDGRDVSRATRFDGDDVRFSADLAPGRHYAEIVVRDRRGNATRYAWNFDVVHDRSYGWDHRGDRPYAQGW